jgi:hypothetical protein
MSTKTRAHKTLLIRLQLLQMKGGQLRLGLTDVPIDDVMVVLFRACRPLDLAEIDRGKSWYIVRQRQMPVSSA